MPKKKIKINKVKFKSFQDTILNLQKFWSKNGCIILQPYDMEVGAGTFHPATTLRSLGPKPWKAAYVQPSRRPTDGRYGDNPNRLQHYYQFQVIIKPSPKNINSKDPEKLQKEIEDSTANAYDLVLNGLELGGGSLRIHEPNLQREVLKTVGLTAKEINEKFGFLIEALEMGAPPHGGIAFGLDRITMLIIGADSIRETIAFPKNQQAKCLLTNAPSNVSESQLKELDIEITIDE